MSEKGKGNIGVDLFERAMDL